MLHVDPHQRLTAPQVPSAHNNIQCCMVTFYLIEFCFNAFQVLRHPWIVDKSQLSDRALTKQSADTVKVIITVIFHVSR